MTLQELKQLQSEVIRKSNKCKSTCLPIIIIIIAITIAFLIIIRIPVMFILFIPIFEFFFGMVICSFISGTLIAEDVERFDKSIKSTFVLESLKTIFSELVYTPKKGLSKLVIEETNIMTTGDKYASNDYISGKYKSVFFEQSDICIEEKNEEKDSDGNKEEVWETIFEGRWMIFDFNKTFKTNIQVASQCFSGNIFCGCKEYDMVEMEDMDFNKRFIVYAESGHDAFYILTPHFMEKLKKIESELKCGIMFCFINNKLHIAIDNNEDSFEFDVFKEINEEEIKNSILKDIKLITNLVEELDLDNNLFKNE